MVPCRSRAPQRHQTPRLAALACTLLLAGCGGSGVTRYHVSGKVTFKGAPVPAGIVLFDPDASAGADGVQGFAEIDNGRYDTRDSGKGTSGGKYVVRIRGFRKADASGSLPRKLFEEYRAEVELPPEHSERDFHVPASQAAESDEPLPPPA